MHDRQGDVDVRNTMFGFGEGLRRFKNKPMKVRGPIPWDDLRWWAMRRYRFVVAEGLVTLHGWQFVLPARCGARRTGETTLELSDGDLQVLVRLVAPDHPSGAPEGAPRWHRSLPGGELITGAGWSEGRAPNVRVEHEVTAPGVPGMRILATMPNPHDRHWVSALVQSVTRTAPDSSTPLDGAPSPLL